MKRNLHKGLFILLISISFVTGCKKTLNTPENDPTASTSVVPHDSIFTAVYTTQNPYPVTPVQECIYAPNYGDSIVYPQPSSGSYYVYPQGTNGLKGKFYTAKVDHNGTSIAIKSYFLLKNGIGYLLTGACLTSQRTTYYPQFEAIVKSFKIK